MSILLTSILLILFAHFIADFVCQTNKMAKGKSKALGPLSQHVAVYSLVMFLILIPFHNSIEMLLVFVIVNGCIHGLIDSLTSRLSSKLYAEGRLGSDRIPNLGFFSVIGFDQLLHYFTLFITYSVLIK